MSCAVEHETALLYVKHKEEQPQGREVQERKETHIAKGKLTLFSLSRVKGPVWVCFTPLRSASSGPAEQGAASKDSALGLM